MATTGELETLREFALEEQMTAAVGGTHPDIELLTDIGHYVLSDLEPVVCTGSGVSHVDFTDYANPVFHRLNEASFNSSGIFAGFAYENRRTEGVLLHKVGYLVVDSIGLDHGFMFPVETSAILDVDSALKDDEKFQEFKTMLEPSNFDIKNVQRFFYKLGKDDEQCKFYGAYLKSVLKPASVFSYMTTSGYLLQRSDNIGYARIAYDVVGTEIGPRDTFGILTVFGVHELSIKKGNNPMLLLPLSLMIGSEVTA